MPGYRWPYQPYRNGRLAPEVYATPGQPTFFTIRAARDRAPFADSRFADIAVRYLLEQRRKSSCALAVYCVMHDHIHAVVIPAIEGTSSLTYIDRLKGWCGRECRLAGWEGALWQPRSYDHVLRKDEALEQVVAYVLQNPVRRGLEASAEDYQWSGMPEAMFGEGIEIGRI
jgi:REP element-mobilizing transposase RayT